MAKPTERPDPAGGGAAPPEPLAYQPLSLQAIVGFGIALVYGLVVLIGFVAATVYGTPWLMPLWTILFPLIGAGMSVMARVRIRRSEGTLAGVALANWGITLSVLFGLIFASYRTATHLVLRQQASSFTRQWFDKLKAGNVEGAFCLTLPPGTRLAEDPKEPAKLRNELESRFNTPGEMSRRGPFGEFLQKDAVRFLVQGGEQTQLKLLRLSFDYVQGGYQVRQTYRVVTPDCTFDLVVPVHGMKLQQKEFQGRQWQVMGNGVQITQMTPSGQGKNALTLQAQAQQFFGTWMELLQKGRVGEAYLATREPAERDDLLKSYRGRGCSLAGGAVGGTWGGGWMGFAAVFVPSALWLELSLPGYREFTQGSLLVVDPDKFVPADKEQKEILAEVRKLFEQPAAGLGRGALVLEPARVLPWKVEKDRFQTRLDVIVVLGNRYLVDGVLGLECDAKALETGAPADWRIAGLELFRARAIASEKPGRGLKEAP